VTSPREPWQAAGVYKIFCDGELIGKSGLEERDESLGVAAGRFEPTAAYEKVRPIFKLFIAAKADGESEPDPAKLEAYETARAGLVLTVQDEAGKSLQTAGMTVLDYSEEGPGEDAYEVEVYFSTPRQFAQLASIN
jgi:hypothetical protein